MILITKRLANAAALCPFCRSGLEDESSIRCGECSTETHAECLTVHGACPVFGCSRALRVFREPPLETLAPRRDGALVLRRFFLGMNLAFALVCSQVIPAIEAAYQDFGIALTGLSQWVISIGGYGNGAGSLVFALVFSAWAIGLSSLLPRHREEVYRSAIFVNIWVVPVTMAWIIMVPMVNDHIYKL